MPVLASDRLFMHTLMPHSLFSKDFGTRPGTRVGDRVHATRASEDAGLASANSRVCPESKPGAHPFSPCHPAGLPLSRRIWLAGLGTAAVTSAVCNRAWAGSFAPIPLEELVASSSHVVVATPRLGDSMWEVVDGSRRIVTYTRLTVDEVLDDREPSDTELLLRTLGGQVGKLGQVVPGEAEVHAEQVCVAFLRARADGTFRVAGLSQGHYPLRTHLDGSQRLIPGTTEAEVYRRDAASAVARLFDQSVPAARTLIREVRRAK